MLRGWRSCLNSSERRKGGAMATQHKNKVSSETLRTDWMRETLCRPEKSRRECVYKLSNPHHRCNDYCFFANMPRLLDHCEWWRAPDGAWVLTAHPYMPIHSEAVAELRGFALALGAELLPISKEKSWYYPGRTALVVLWGRTSGGWPLRRAERFKRGAEPVPQ